MDTKNLDKSFNSLNRSLNLTKKEEEFEQSLRTLTTIYDIPKKSHDELRTERVLDLNNEYKIFINEEEYEKAITIVKKLIFFDPTSKNEIINKKIYQIKHFSIIKFRSKKLFYFS